ncbi:GntR family transcriptional regulator [Lachnospiraceae bacterium PF1-21]|uniref:GntR family transcriptional regulator n=1 Tax=Ohessyouella blattaphilus TaxID=2949333 RepID=UPI00255F6EB1|nr:GntR family transcriptional regulator [Lachnospiraceae bacterium OttesenSCG-928-J05]
MKKNEIDYRAPIYMQLRERLREKIENGEFPPGTSIPSEFVLARLYEINRITVRNAIDALVNEGLLLRVQGKGVFVLSNKVTLSLDDHQGFVSTFKQEDQTHSLKVKEQTKALRYAGKKHGETFQLDPDDYIYYLRHLTLHNDIPRTLEDLYLPAKLLPNLGEIDTALFPLEDILAFYNIRVKEVHQSMEIVSGDAKIRKFLDTPHEVSLLMLECLYVDDNEQVISYTRSYTRSDMGEYTISLHTD